MNRKNLLLLSLSMFAFAILAALPVFAQDATAAKEAGGILDYFKVVGEGVLPTLFMIALPILLLLVRRLIVYLEKKWNFDMSEQSEAALMEAIGRAVNYAEEKALKALKTGDDIPSGAAKLKVALEYAVDEMERMKLDTLARDKLVALIESKLFEKRASGALPASEKVPAQPKKDG